MKFLQHNSFSSELKRLTKKYRNAEKALSDASRLIEAHFTVATAIAPGKIHHVTAFDNCEIWKFEMVIPSSGLKPNQYPRIWFSIVNDCITFLLIATHIDGYDNNVNDKKALDRYTDLS